MRCGSRRLLRGPVKPTPQPCAQKVLVSPCSYRRLGAGPFPSPDMVNGPFSKQGLAPFGFSHSIRLGRTAETGRSSTLGGQVMRTALLTATALVALSSLAIGQNQLPATTASKANAVVDPAMPKVRTNAPGGGRLHYDMPCRVSSVG